MPRWAMASGLLFIVLLYAAPAGAADRSRKQPPPRIGGLVELSAAYVDNVGYRRDRLVNAGVEVRPAAALAADWSVSRLSAAGMARFEHLTVNTDETDATRPLVDAGGFVRYRAAPRMEIAAHDRFRRTDKPLSGGDVFRLHTAGVLLEWDGPSQRQTALRYSLQDFHDDEGNAFSTFTEHGIVLERDSPMPLSQATGRFQIGYRTRLFDEPTPAMAGEDNVKDYWALEALVGARHRVADLARWSVDLGIQHRAFTNVEDDNSPVLRARIDLGRSAPWSLTGTYEWRADDTYRLDPADASDRWPTPLDDLDEEYRVIDHHALGVLGGYRINRQHDVAAELHVLFSRSRDSNDERPPVRDLEESAYAATLRYRYRVTPSLHVVPSYVSAWRSSTTRSRYLSNDFMLTVQQHF